MQLPDPVQLAIPAFVIMIVAEIIWVRMRGPAAGRYEWRDAATSISMGFGSLIAGILTGGIYVVSALAIAEFRVTEWGFVWWAWALCVLIDDFAYYLFHRSAHRVRWFWASHVIHHSSQHYNLTTALRQTWTGTLSFSFVFRLPLFLVFEPAMVFFVSAANLVYQFWIHTEVVGRMPRWFEAVMNTPSHHRVHHATNPQCLDRNYAGMFIIWDRMFGTFAPEPEGERLDYGIIKNLDTFNPLRVATHEWAGIIADMRSAPDWRSRWHYLAAPPGWSHDGSRETSDSIRARWMKRRLADR